MLREEGPELSNISIEPSNYFLFSYGLSISIIIYIIYICLISLKHGHWVFACSLVSKKLGAALTVGGWIRPGGQN